MKYLHAEARGVQARECLKEIDDVLRKWNFKLVPTIMPFITRGYTPTVLDFAEGYHETTPATLITEVIK